MILTTWMTWFLQDYLKAMACAANYAWVNRSSMTFLCRQAFAKLFKQVGTQLSAAACLLTRLGRHVLVERGHELLATEGIDGMWVSAGARRLGHERRVRCQPQYR